VNDGRQSALPTSDQFSPRPYTGTQRPSFPQQSSPGREPFRTDDPITTNIDETIASTDLHATSDALNMLSQAAQLDTYSTPGQRSSHTADRPAVLSPQNHPTADSRHSDGATNVAHGSIQYPLVSQGLLTVSQIAQLVARYGFPQMKCAFADD
jgi:hypothetical protein